MLTLQELKQVVSNREERRKVPSAKYLRENEVAVAKQRLMDCAEIIAYQTGYVLYCVGDYATVFPLFTCRDYVYEAERKIAVVEEDFFDDQEREDSIKMKMRFKRFLSGFMAVATLA